VKRRRLLGQLEAIARGSLACSIALSASLAAAQEGSPVPVDAPVEAPVQQPAESPAGAPVEKQAGPTPETNDASAQDPAERPTPPAPPIEPDSTLPPPVDAAQDGATPADVQQPNPKPADTDAAPTSPAQDAGKQDAGKPNEPQTGGAPAGDGAPTGVPPSAPTNKVEPTPPVGDATPAPGAPLGPTPNTPLALPTYEPRYRAASEATLWCDSIELAAPDRVRRFDLATTRDGRVTPALEIAAPGPTPPSERPTIFVIGGLDGRSLAGAEAALYVARELAQNSAELGPNLSIIVAPFANVEALDQCARSGASDGRTQRPFDDDRDGLVDEDGPDDLDDDGLILEMLVESPQGEWTLSDDSRWVMPATASTGRRFLRVRGGRDDDGDGRFNEDPIGGVDLDRNFPVLREGPWADSRVGALPLSEPVSRALAELARTRTCLATLLLQGHHGGAAIPGGSQALDAWTAADRGLYEQAAAMFDAATGRRPQPALTLREARGAERPGAALDWFAVSCGSLALELAPWGPALDEAAPNATTSAGFEPRAPSAPPLAPADLEWTRWLDEARDGMGYVSWRPVALGDGRTAYVGGFEPWTVENPPPDHLERALRGVPAFVRELCAQAPQLSFERLGATRNAGVLRVRASLRNIGGLPTNLQASAASTTARPLTVRIELAGDARLLAGPQTVRVPSLSGGELSREFEWLVLAPAPASLRLRAEGGWCPPIEREVRE